ncbi:MAG TPA: choice-of-anchor J domain-containing protein [Bacteroidota bacterium]|nr:choice-of-anchor J domain-containing protein [Bacteroidota bacterium]
MKHLLMGLSVALVLVLAISTATAQKKTAGKEVGIAVKHVLSPARLTDGTVIFSEGFNDTSLSSPWPPAGWTVFNAALNSTSIDSSWYQSLSVGGTGGPGPYEGVAFAADYYGSANADNLIDDYLITPNTGGTAATGDVDSLIFWAASRLSSSGNYPDSLDIRVSTTDAKPASFTTRLDYILATKAVWTRYAYALPMATNRYIAFRYLVYDGGSAGDNSDKVCLDAVQIVRYGPSAVHLTTELVPPSFALKQNFPNPFNPTTTIVFQLSKASRTSLTVMNDVGEVVSTIVKEYLPAGTYKASFDASRLASGVYFYRLVAGSFVDTKRMLLLK